MESIGKRQRQAAVKVQVRIDAPNFDQPWSRRGVDDAVGSGLILEVGGQPAVLTNAHVVDHAVLVEVRRYGDASRYPCLVEAVSQDCDLALLRVQDEAFYRGAATLELGTAPDLGDEVTVMGFPIGGERLSITRGIVSRIEMTPYSQSERRLLSMQIDAAINPGNSGGPVLQDGRVVGVAFENLSEGDNIGYIIPAPVVRHFLTAVAEGRPPGFPDLGVSTQPLESPAHRRALALPERGGGVLVTGLSYQGSCWGVLRPGDVLLEVEGTEVAFNGSVPYLGSQRLDFSFLTTQHALGDTVTLGIWRQGDRQELEVALRPPARLLRKLGYLEAPGYYVFGGLVFVPLTLDYLWSWDEGPSEAPLALRDLYWYGVREPAREEVVVLQYVLADQINKGYHHLANRVIVGVDGVPPRSLADLVSRIEGGSERFVTITTRRREVIVLDRAEAAARGAEILANFAVPADRSSELPQVLLPGPLRAPEAT